MAMTRSNLAIQFSPMLYLFFISFVPLILIPYLIKLWSLWLCGEFSKTTMTTRLRKWVATKTTRGAKRVVEEERESSSSSSATSLLDLPDLALDCILERLSPEALRAISGVCVALRDTCTSDHLWERHWRGKWGRVIGENSVRRREWLSESEPSQDERERGGLFRCLVDSFRFSMMTGAKEEKKKIRKLRTDLPPESAMASYFSLESGNFCFPAQVYNRESGHIGFMLSCYDADVCYDSKSNTFEARYSPHGRRTAEENVEWERLREAPVETHPFTLHVSDCLHDLRPGDHVEIQWRRNKEFPYGWWYGVVAHSKTCDASESLCCCHHSDIVVLEFKQYNPGSKWRQTTVNRRDHREEGNTVDGFYGGIRKLYNAEEISRWNHFWPPQTLEQ